MAGQPSWEPLMGNTVAVADTFWPGEHRADASDSRNVVPTTASLMIGCRK